MLCEGRGVPQNCSKAMKWYRNAAEQGDTVAQRDLGLIYDNGWGVPQNHIQAYKWYHLAADQGIPVAQHNLGLLYAEGRGVPRDYVQAYKWLDLAAAAGDADAAKQRDSVPEQAAQAQKLASDWMLAKAQEKAAKCQASNLEDCDCC